MTSSTEDIATIFARDPLTLTVDDLNRIVEKYRAARATFQAGGPKTPKATASKEKLTELDLDGLGI
jgi:hypothetical protein